MQRLIRIFTFIGVLIPFLTINLNAQGSPGGGGESAHGNIIVMTKYEMAFFDNWDGAELDSLTNEYTKYCYDRNEYILSYRTIRHWWGNNSRDFIVITEVKNWDDLNKANEREGELFRKHWATKEQREAFYKAYDKYFTGKHSDEIYRDTKIR